MTKSERTQAAKKAARTRKRNHAKRSEAAKKGARTRKREHAQHVRAGKLGAAAAHHKIHRGGKRRAASEKIAPGGMPYVIADSPQSSLFGVPIGQRTRVRGIRGGKRRQATHGGAGLIAAAKALKAVWK